MSRKLSSTTFCAFERGPPSLGTRPNSLSITLLDLLLIFGADHIFWWKSGSVPVSYLRHRVASSVVTLNRDVAKDLAVLEPESYNTSWPPFSSSFKSKMMENWSKYILQI